MLHIPWYSIQGKARLAEDTLLSAMTTTRAIAGDRVQTETMQVITEAIADRFGQTIALEEIFSTDSTYPTECVCELMGCPGCLPPEAWDNERDELRDTWRDTKPSQWCRGHPNRNKPTSVSVRQETVSGSQKSDVGPQKTDDRARLEASPCTGHATIS